MGLTKPRAAQIFNLDYKQSTRAVTVANVVLTGGAPSSVDGVSLIRGDRILVTGQTTGSQNGIYKVSVVGSGTNGTWIRTKDSDQTGEVEAGMIVMVTEGNIYADTQWKLTTNDPIIIGDTDLTFVINILSTVGGANTQVQYNQAGTLAGSSNFTFDSTLNILLVTGDINSSNLSVTGNITGANLNSSNADLAEMYVADASYLPGTLVEFGGIHEITVTHASHATAVAGVVSTAPGYLMNIMQSGEHVLPVALTGRVPCYVMGAISKGDRLVSSDRPGVAQTMNKDLYEPGCIIGKALEDYNSPDTGVIEIAVGRF
jgi:phage-related tail fiber protein